MAPAPPKDNLRQVRCRPQAFFVAKSNRSTSGCRFTTQGGSSGRYRIRYDDRREGWLSHPQCLATQPARFVGTSARMRIPDDRKRSHRALNVPRAGKATTRFPTFFPRGGHFLPNRRHSSNSKPPPQRFWAGASPQGATVLHTVSAPSDSSLVMTSTKREFPQAVIPSG